MHFLFLASMAFAAYTNVAAGAPAAQNQYLPKQPPMPTHYCLRIAAPKQPWHNRHIIQLPSGLLGLENFTVHPTTPPLPVIPIQIPGQSTYALRLSYGGDDLSRTPYIAALLPMDKAQTSPSHARARAPATSASASLSVVYVPDPTKKTLERNAEACPEGVECVADEFAIVGRNYGGKSGSEVLGRLGYAGFEGHWEAVKDVVNGEGWEAHWVAGGEKDGEELEIEVVQIK